MFSGFLFGPSWRENLVAPLTGDVLEIGVGEGANLPFYGEQVRLVAVEPHAARAEAARRTAARLGLAARIETASAEQLPFPDQGFDHVVSSLVFCSVSDPALVLAEIGRVLRPGGFLHLYEHVRPQSPALAALFAFVTPGWRKIAHNCHLDRPTVETLRSSGWQVIIHSRRWVLVRMTAQLMEPLQG
jgi:ubiquinone/menaquinone biosynthesis C-methylase UbiE